MFICVSLAFSNYDEFEYARDCCKVSQAHKNLDGLHFEYLRYNYATSIIH